MRVAWNAFFLGQESTGSGQYTQQLLQAFAQLDTHNEYLLYTMGKPAISADPGPYALRVLPTPFTRLSDNLAKLWFEQVSLARACRNARADLCHVPYFASPLRPAVPTVVTVHDLIPLLLPLYRGSVMVRLYTQLVAAAARRADRVITDSLHSKNDIVRHLRVPAERVHVIYLAAHPMCRPITDENVLADTRTKYGLPLTYILYLGGFDQRKNLSALLQAYAGMCRVLGDKALALVVAGRLPPADTPLFPAPQRMATELGIAGRVVFTGWVAEEDKPALYSGALFFAFLSLYEGFGLMPLEAMSCGTPVLVANRSSLPEIVGSGGVLVDPENLDQITEHMVTLVRDAALRQHLAQEALSQAIRFDWRDTARQTLRAYDLTAGLQKQLLPRVFPKS
ncbi:MAG: glycosyltransferase family 4 protein [Chloroflexi bacterium]|nr:glycosyltransferase family 4 protein [Chloroflexota bacterium]